MVKSRSEASAFLIAEGIKARDDLFSRIGEKIDTIRAARQELRDLMGNSLEDQDEPEDDKEGADQADANETPKPQE
ncbi:MAG TPA: hypothetical protein QF520_15290 [SAR202 cluster bacterium]|nr:hypothetical protein [SAR202 cluster bacterium]